MERSIEGTHAIFYVSPCRECGVLFNPGCAVCVMRYDLALCSGGCGKQYVLIKNDPAIRTGICCNDCMTVNVTFAVLASNNFCFELPPMTLPGRTTLSEALAHVRGQRLWSVDSLLNMPVRNSVLGFETTLELHVQMMLAGFASDKTHEHVLNYLGVRLPAARSAYGLGMPSLEDFLDCPLPISSVFSADTLIETVAPVSEVYQQPDLTVPLSKIGRGNFRLILKCASQEKEDEEAEEPTVTPVSRKRVMEDEDDELTPNVSDSVKAAHHMRKFFESCGFVVPGKEQLDLWNIDDCAEPLTIICPLWGEKGVEAASFFDHIPVDWRHLASGVCDGKKKQAVKIRFPNRDDYLAFLNGYANVAIDQVVGDANDMDGYSHRTKHPELMRYITKAIRHFPGVEKVFDKWLNEDLRNLDALPEDTPEFENCAHFHRHLRTIGAASRIPALFNASSNKTKVVPLKRLERASKRPAVSSEEVLALVPSSEFGGGQSFGDNDTVLDPSVPIPLDDVGSPEDSNEPPEDK